MQIVYIFAKKTLDKFLNKWQNKRVEKVYFSVP